MKSMYKLLVVGGSGFIGSYLMSEVDAVNLDLKGGQDVRDGINGEYDTIVFLACNQANTREAYLENRQMYEALNDYCKAHNDTYLIYISSAAVYTPNSWYALSKYLGEAYARRFSHHAILRLSNVYGNGDGHGAPDRFLRGEKVIHGDGKQTRDLIPVEKVVTAILECLSSESVGIFNVSSGRDISVNDMFKLFGTGSPHHAGQDVGVYHSVLLPGVVYEG